MSRTRGRVGFLVTAGMAWGGVVLGHVLTYLIAYPAPADRHAHLAGTGHGSFDLLLLSLVAVLPMALALMGARALRSADPLPVRRTATGLLALQIPAFMFLEMAERGPAGSGALSDPAVAAGLAVQAVVAVISAVLLAVLVRTVRVVAGRLRRPARRPRAVPPLRFPPVEAVRRDRYRFGGPLRAPPLPRSA